MTRWWELFWTDDEVFLSTLFLAPVFIMMMCCAIAVPFVMAGWVKHELQKINREKERQ